MIIFGWITSSLRNSSSSTRAGRRLRSKSRLGAPPRVEALEAIELMSHASPHAALHHAPAIVQPTIQAIPFTSNTIAINSTHALATQTTQLTALQTVTVPDQLTNFSSTFAPPINLFDSTLGQLVAVHINANATLSSQIQSENTSTTSPAAITGSTTGTFSIDGLGAPVTGALNASTAVFHAQPFDGVVDYSGPSGVTYPLLTATSTHPTINITDPALLATFIATPGHTTLTPTLTASAQSGANAPDGNLRTQVRTSGSGIVTITYEYAPQVPPVTKIVRYGIHHQPTLLVVSFGGPLNPIDASNAANYVIIAPNHSGSFTGPGTTTIPIVSATYNPVTNSVSLLPATALNVHHLFQLRITLPSNNNNPIVVEFGGKKSLGGFYYHGKHFIVVNGKAFPG